MGHDGQQYIDIQSLYAKGNLFCFDPGYSWTASCPSAISMTAPAGKLYYRGYDIEELVEKSTYIEVCYIMLYGERPEKKLLQEFESKIKKEMLVH